MTHRYYDKGYVVPVFNLAYHFKDGAGGHKSMHSYRWLPQVSKIFNSIIAVLSSNLRQDSYLPEGFYYFLRPFMEITGHHFKVEHDYILPHPSHCIFIFTYNFYKYLIFMYTIIIALY